MILNSDEEEGCNKWGRNRRASSENIRSDSRVEPWEIGLVHLTILEK